MATSGKVQVYKLDAFDFGNNSHMTDRRESWTLKKDETFDTLDEAKDHIRQKSRSHTYLPNLLVGLPEEVKKQAIEEFCFTDKYLFHQRYWLTPPSKASFQKAVEAQGANFVKEK
jgi:hypothetical protein